METISHTWAAAEMASVFDDTGNIQCIIPPPFDQKQRVQSPAVIIKLNKQKKWHLKAGVFSAQMRKADC